MKPIFITVAVLGTLPMCAQTTYPDAIKKADELYNAKDYKNSGLAYSQAFKLDKKARELDLYNAACSYSLAQMADSSFAQLSKIASVYSDFDHASRDSDLDNLHTDKRWEKWISGVKKNQETALAKLDRPLMEKLEQTLRNDQKFAREIQELARLHGTNSPEVTKQTELYKKLKAENEAFVTQLLDARGFLNQDVVGGLGVTCQFLVIQHSDKAKRQKYLPMFKEAAAKGDLPFSSYATMQDRVDIENGRKQKYGSQIVIDPETKMVYVRPVENPEKLEKTRQEAGLQPMDDYLKAWKTTWSPDQYRKDLSKIEKLDKTLPIN